MNRDFLVSVLLRDFKSHDLHSAAQLLYAKDDGSDRFDLLNSIDERRVTACLMDILDLWNKDERNVAVSEAHLSNVRDWLRALDLLRFTPVKSSDWTDMPPHAVFTQPGMRYAQAQALVFALSKDEKLARHLRDAEKIAAVEARHGTVVSRTVLYRGKSFEAPDGVAWRNVEDYLESLYR